MKKVQFWNDCLTLRKFRFKLTQFMGLSEWVLKWNCDGGETLDRQRVDFDVNLVFEVRLSGKGKFNLCVSNVTWSSPARVRVAFKKKDFNCPQVLCVSYLTPSTFPNSGELPKVLLFTNLDRNNAKVSVSDKKDKRKFQIVLIYTICNTSLGKFGQSFYLHKLFCKFNRN